MSIGEREQFVDWLETLDPADPRTLISWVLGRYRGETAFPIERLSEAAREVAISFMTLLEDTGTGQPSGTRFAALGSVVSARDAVLAEVLAQAVELENRNAFLDRLDLRLHEFMDPTSDELDDRLMTTVWHATPSIAALLDLPWTSLDERVADRCRLHLGWLPGDPIDPSGARVRQLELKAPAQQLRDLRFTLGLRPAGLLDPQTRMLGTFDWLLAEHERSVRDDERGPRAWFFKHQGLLSLESAAVPDNILDLIRQHLEARMPPYGTEPWAAVPAMLLAAAVHHRWSPQMHKHAALTALEEALSWGRQLIRSDGAMLTAMAITTEQDS